MRIPARLVPKKIRFKWTLAHLSNQIAHARSARNNEELLQSIQRLYPKLGKNGVPVPSVITSPPGSDPTTWYAFHQRVLFRLSQHVVEDNFDLDEWSEYVQEEGQLKVLRGSDKTCLEQKILAFILDLRGDNQRVTNKDVYCKFLGVSVSSIHSHLLTMIDSGYIAAKSTGQSPLSIEIHGVTEKGRQALRGSDDEQTQLEEQNSFYR